MSAAGESRGDALRLLILGNSGAGRECHDVLQELLPLRPDLHFEGFLSFEGFSGSLGPLQDQQKGTDDDYAFAPDTAVILALGNNELRRRALAKMRSRGVRLFNLIAANVHLAEGVTLGEGNVLARGCHLAPGVGMGDANYLNGSVCLGHDVSLGSYNFFGPFSAMLGASRMGDANSLGTHAVVLERARVGSGNSIAPGSYVYKGCGNNCYYAGNPALNLGEKFPFC